MLRTSLTRLSRRCAAAHGVHGAAARTTLGTPTTLRCLSTSSITSSSSTGGATLSALTGANPHVDVVRYEHKNRVWSLQHVEYYSTAMAIGFLDGGLQPADVVLSWLPAHFSEQMILQFACSKAGLVLYTLETPADDQDKAADALAAALSLTKANMLVTPEAYNDVNFIRLTEGVIPELRIFIQESGLPFVTPRFPHLRYAVHTGFDQDDKFGWLPYRYFLVPSDNLDKLLPDTTPFSAHTPLAGSFKLDPASGIPTAVGPTLTNQEVLDDRTVWPTYSDILQKKFHEVEGVGVTF